MVQRLFGTVNNEERETHLVNQGIKNFGIIAKWYLFRLFVIK